MATPKFSPEQSHYIQIMKDNGFTDTFTNVDIIEPPLHGEHFASSVFYVNMHRVNANPLQLFVKRIVKNEEYAKNLRELQLFDKEAGFFFQIIPELKRYIASKTNSSDAYVLDMIPKCYFGDSEEIVMENLINQGYVLLNKLDRQDLTQAKLVMKSLAKLHAPSYLLTRDEITPEALAQKYPILNEVLENTKCDNMFMSWLNTMLKTAHTLIRETGREGSDVACKIIDDFMDNTLQKFKDWVRRDGSEVFVCVNHGDCWNNNIMFQNHPSNHPNKFSRSMLLDFQMCRLGSPSLDLSYYFFTSVKHNVRKREWQTLLRSYYDHLVEFTRILGNHVHFSFEDLLQDYRNKFYFGFVFGICVSGAFDAGKDIGDLEQIKGDIVEHMDKAITNWAKRNPQKSMENGLDLLGVMQEYQELIKN